MENYKAFLHTILVISFTTLFAISCSEKTDFAKLHDGDGGIGLGDTLPDIDSNIEKEQENFPDKNDRDNSDRDGIYKDTIQDIDDDEPENKPDADSDKKIEEDESDVDTELEDSVYENEALLPDADTTFCEEDFSAGNKKCDFGTKKSCSLIDSKYNWGEADCLEDCSGWEKSECVKLIRWGSTSAEKGSSIVIDKSDNIYFYGHTKGNIAKPNNNKDDIVLTKFDSSFAEIWTKQIGTDSSDISAAMTIDSGENIYIAGYTSGKLGDDPIIGGSDAFLMKLNSSGEQTWTRQLGSTANDKGLAVVYWDNSVYIGIRTEGKFPDKSHHGNADIAIAEFYTNSTFVWSAQYGTSNYDSINDLQVNSSGDLITAGYTGADFNGEEHKGGHSDILTMKLTGSGNVNWTKLYGTNYDNWEVANSVSISSEGDIYTCGNLGSGSDGLDAALIKYAADGTKIWDKVITTNMSDEAFDSAIDKDGNISIHGTFGIACKIEIAFTVKKH